MITQEQLAIAADKGIDELTVVQRVYTLSWDIERAITQPKRKQRKPIDKKLVARAVANGINKNALTQRIYVLGWDADRACTEPLASREEMVERAGQKNRKYPAEMIELAAQNGIAYATFRDRVKNQGWDMQRAATERLKNRKGVMT